MNPDAGLYVHIPFCSAICPYCDFAVVTGTTEHQHRFYELLLSDLRTREFPWEFDTVYLGGGTPSLVPVDVLYKIRESLPLASNCSWFLEANPEDVNCKSVAQWEEFGVHTLSLGIQSFDDEALLYLGRRHSGSDAERAIQITKNANFKTLSLDLIFGYPGQTLSDWKLALDKTASYAPDHISCYQLTIYKDTHFGRQRTQGDLVELKESLQADLFLETHRFLNNAGYEGYEVSNFSYTESHRSRHNEKYWKHKPYVGVGPSAHSFDGYRTRSWNVRTLSEWEECVKAGRDTESGRETLCDEQLLTETIMLRLRTREGLELDSLRQRFGWDLLDFNQKLVSKLVKEGLVSVDGSVLRPTLNGLAVADRLAASFRLPEKLQ